MQKRGQKGWRELTPKEASLTDCPNSMNFENVACVI